MTVQSCMGGWCAKRDHCANYHAASEDQTPSQRLCPPGQDGAGPQLTGDETVTMTQTMIARVRAVITAAGKSIADIAAEAGMHPTNVRGAVRALAKEGAVFTCRRNDEGTKQHFLMVFSDKAARDVMHAECCAATKAKQRLFRMAFRARKKREEDPARRERLAAQERAAEAKRAEAQAKRAAAERRAAAAQMRAAEVEIAKQRKRLDREARAAELKREKAEAKAQQKRLKAQTREAGKLAKIKGTTTPKAAPARGPALLAGELDLSRAKITRLPTPPERFAASAAPSVITSAECRGWAQAVAA